MNDLSVGFARLNIDPPRNIGISGYYVVRKSEGILDSLEVSAVALSSGESRVLLLSADLLNIKTAIARECKKRISLATGVPYEAIYIHATHTHTGPYLDSDFKMADHFSEEEKALMDEYGAFFMKRCVDVSLSAIEDLAPAVMGYAVGKAENISFIRRYRMKDGSVRTNPGVNNPDILEPLGTLDNSVSLLRFDREGRDSVALVSFADHPDVVGGSKTSADWPGFFRRTLEKSIDGVKAIFFNGAQGDVNHVNVHPTGGYLNDTFMDFDDVSRGYGHARFMGRVVAGAVLSIYDKVKYTEVSSLRYIERTVNVPSNMPTPDEMPEARRIAAIHREGRDEELPYKGMMLTTVVADAERKLRLEMGPEAFPMTFSAIAIGDVAFFGIPGEPFNGIGCGVKAAEGYSMVIPSCLVNGSEGYFPLNDAYEQGGYEARSSNFKAGVADLIVSTGLSMLEDIRE